MPILTNANGATLVVPEVLVEQYAARGWVRAEDTPAEPTPDEQPTPDAADADVEQPDTTQPPARKRGKNQEA